MASTSRDLALVGAREESTLNFFNGGFDGPGTTESEVEGNGCEWEVGGREGGKDVVVGKGCDEGASRGDVARCTDARTMIRPPGCSSPMSGCKLLVPHAIAEEICSRFRLDVPELAWSVLNGVYHEVGMHAYLSLHPLCRCRQ